MTLRIFGVMVGAAGIWMFLSSMPKGTEFRYPRLILPEGASIDWGLFLAGVGALALGAVGMRVGQRMQWPVFDDLEELSRFVGRSERRLILFLRSFETDGAREHSREGLYPGDFDSRTDEEVLAKYLFGLGILVAVGRPWERLPQVGAYRLYISDSDWKSVVGELISKASLIVLRAGSTDGLRWELEEVVRSQALGRTAIVLSAGDQVVNEAIVEMVASAINVPLDEEASESMPAGSVLVAAEDSLVSIPRRPQRNLDQPLAEAIAKLELLWVEEKGRSVPARSLAKAMASVSRLCVYISLASLVSFVVLAQHDFSFYFLLLFLCSSIGGVFAYWAGGNDPDV